MRRIALRSIVASLVAIPLAHAVTFSDISPSAWYASYVDRAQEAGIVSGYKDANDQPTGMFGPTSNVTVAEAAKMAVEASRIADTGAAVDTGDIQNHWAARYIKILRQRNVGERNMTFLSGKDLDRPLTRGELANMLSVSLWGAYAYGDVPPCLSETQPLFSDVTISHPEVWNIANVMRLNLMVGDNRTAYDEDASARECPPLTTFRPADALNRAEAAKVMVLAREVVERFCQENASGEGYFGYQDGPSCEGL